MTGGTTHTTILALTLTATLALAHTAQAQFSFGGGSPKLGGYGRGGPSFNVGRQVQSAVPKPWRQVGLQPSRVTTDMRYRGPNPAAKPDKRGRIVVGTGMGISFDPKVMLRPGSNRTPDRDFLIGKPENPECIINDPGYGERQPCPNPEIVVDHPDCVTQPCPVVEPPPVVVEPQPVNHADVALALTYEAQKAFKMQNYTLATDQMDCVLELSPESAAAYQFRALTHFALGDYDEAAVDVYETLLRGPIWDWKTVYPLYDNQYTYTNQYRALSRAAIEDPGSMPKHFVLAYHHLLLGHLEHGEKELKNVLRIQPNEPVTQKLLAVVQQLRAQDSVASR